MLPSPTGQGVAAGAPHTAAWDLIANRLVRRRVAEHATVVERKYWIVARPHSNCYSAKICTFRNGCWAELPRITILIEKSFVEVELAWSFSRVARAEWPPRRRFTLHEAAALPSIAVESLSALRVYRSWSFIGQNAQWLPPRNFAFFQLTSP